MNPNAAADDSSNLITVTRRNVNGHGIHQNAIKSILRPNGIAEIFEYGSCAIGINGNYPTIRTNIIWRGHPGDENVTNVVDGTKTISTIGSRGETLTNRVYDVESGIMTSRQIFGYDGRNRLINTTNLGNLVERRTYDETCSCGLLETKVDVDGTTNAISYDKLNRLVSSTRAGIASTNIYDAVGNLLQTGKVGTNGTTIVSRSTTYDTAGRVILEEDAMGNQTSFSYSYVNSKQVKTTTYANLSTRVETYYRDGRLEKVTGTGIFPVYYQYGVELDGSDYRRFSKEIRADNASASEWVKHLEDGAGRSYKTLYPDGASSVEIYNSVGQLERRTDADGVSTLFKYDADGNAHIQATDLNGDKAVNANSDRMSLNTNYWILSTSFGSNMRRPVRYDWSTNGNTASNIVSSTYTSRDGLTNFSIFYGAGVGSISSNKITYAGNGYVITTNWAPNRLHTVTTNRYGRLLSMTRRYPAGPVVWEKTYGYDAYGRPSTVTDIMGTTTTTYNNADQVVSVTTPAPGSGHSAQTTTRHYDNMGRVWKIDHPDGTAVTNEYHLNGLLKRTSGSRTLPVGYGYDSQGRMRYMTNWSDFRSSAGARVTEWQYDSRGFMTNKLYSGEQGPSYAYTLAGRLKTRWWARQSGGQRLSTTYTTNAAGDFASIVYSDGTTGITNGYDRLGQLISVTHGDVVTTRTYNEQNLLLTEKYTGGLLNGMGITNRYDEDFYRTNLLGQAASVAFDYNSALRLDTISCGIASFKFGYYAGMEALVNSVTASNSAVKRLVNNYNFDKLVRLTNVNSEVNGTVKSLFAYQYNAANQRTRRTELDNSYWSYEYDELGQVKSGKRYWPDGSPVPGQQYEYGFDDIGNREHTLAGGNEYGTGLRYSGYSANSFNQITNRAVPPFLDFVGTATNNATVTVNNSPTYRKGDYWRAELNVDNASALWLAVTNTAVQPNGASPDKVTNIVGNVFVPPARETFVYDADGNLTADGRRTLTWDGENRLTKVESLSGAPLASTRKVEFKYDYQGRMIQRTVSNGSTGTYIITENLKYVYDGFRCMAELNVSGGTGVRTYVWGPDLSGSLDGAGGVGGLLGVFMHDTSTWHLPFYDGNGNVTGLVDGSGGSVSANYEYDPFGGITRETGVAAKQNRFRFSTKYTDDQTDLVYYGFRFYNPSTGRWLNRDKIEEKGGLNLYGFAFNTPVLYFDTDGRLAAGPSVAIATTIGTSSSGGAGTTITVIGGAGAVGGSAISGPVIIGGVAVGALGVGIGYGTSQVPVIGGGTVADFYGEVIYDAFFPKPIPVMDPPPLPQPQPKPIKPPAKPEDPSKPDQKKCGCKFQRIPPKGHDPVHDRYAARLQGGFSQDYLVTDTAPGGMSCAFDAGIPYSKPQVVFEAKTRHQFMNNGKVNPKIVARLQEQFVRCSTVAKKCGLKYIIAVDNPAGATGIQTRFPMFDIRYIPSP